MRSIAKIVCCGVALVWMHGAVAAGNGTDAVPPGQGEPVKPYYVKKWDRPRVEKRIKDQSTMTQKRKGQARKSVPLRQAPPPVPAK